MVQNGDSPVEKLPFNPLQEGLKLYNEHDFELYQLSAGDRQLLDMERARRDLEDGVTLGKLPYDQYIEARSELDQQIIDRQTALGLLNSAMTTPLDRKQ
ncbi:MAG TPA: hypothetical protein VG992_02275 [Candidatus Saccharimonadales bacterium]|nr:hypothetical protein [Candidatus Saccharimonadales bacterium]